MLCSKYMTVNYFVLLRHGECIPPIKTLFFPVGNSELAEWTTLSNGKITTVNVVNNCF